MTTPASRIARLRAIGFGDRDTDGDAGGPGGPLIEAPRERYSGRLGDLEDEAADSAEDLERLPGREGWTPPLPSRHRGPQPVQHFRMRIGWRAGLVLVVAVAGLGLVVLMKSFAATPTTTVPTRAMPSASAQGQAVAPSDRPRVEPTGAGEPAATPTQAADVLAHVVGAVASPGVVRLTAGTRVADAVSAAGGARDDADLSGLNLARVLTDGEQVVVPTPGQMPVPVAGGPAGAQVPTDRSGGAGSAAVGAAGATTVNLNTATVAELDALPGIGPVLAARIVEWRTANGNFTSVDELGEVAGIGDKLLEKLRPEVSL